MAVEEGGRRFCVVLSVLEGFIVLVFFLFLFCIFFGVYFSLVGSVFFCGSEALPT